MFSAMHSCMMLLLMSIAITLPEIRAYEPECGWPFFWKHGETCNEQEFKERSAVCKRMNRCMGDNLTGKATDPPADEEAKHWELLGLDDMRLTKDQCQELLDVCEENHGKPARRRRKRKVRSGLTSKWALPIRYKIDKNFGREQAKDIRKSIAMWESKTCIKFKELDFKTKYNDNHLIFNYQGQGCLSYIGKAPIVPQPIYLSDVCFGVGTVAHEIGHALGLIHEHQRPDRDQYIKILSGNIMKFQKSHFARFPPTLAETHNLPYDYASDMHYHATAFGQNVSNTIETKDPLYMQTIGQRVQLSFLDYRVANIAYCSKKCKNSQKITCKNGGYQSPKDCTICLCPDGWQGPRCESISPSKMAQCGGILQADSARAYVTSPRYYMPKPYNTYSIGQECTWLIEAPPKKNVIFRFVDEFGVYCYSNRCYHWVEVRYKNDMGATGPRFCCSGRPDVTLRSEGQKVMVLFRAIDRFASINRRQGFKFEYFADGDECEGNPCQNGGTCTDRMAGFVCKCLPGYEGNRCQIMVNPCLSRPCRNGATCSKTSNGYWCRCATGYDGKRCERVVNACKSGPCRNGATCYNTANGYWCRCSAGYEGNQCEREINECLEKPCTNGGTCVDHLRGYTCLCPVGYTGHRCEEKINACLSNPCRNGATCNTFRSGYWCQCVPGYQGQQCQKEINECLERPCLNGGTCVDQLNGFKCVCRLSYTGQRCEHDLNECEGSTCLNGGKCVPVYDGFQCHCRNGFDGDRCQLKKKLDPEVPNIDLAILLDISRRRNKDIATIVNFIAVLVTKLNFGLDKSRVGLVVYDRYPVVKSYLNSNDKVDDFLDTLHTLHMSISSNYLLVGLWFVESRIFTMRGGDRANVPNMALLITDSSPSDLTYREWMVDRTEVMKNMGIKLLTLSIGSLVPENLMQDLTGKRENAFHVPTYDQLLDQNLLRNLFSRMIAMTSETSTTTTRMAPTRRLTTLQTTTTTRATTTTTTTTQKPSTRTSRMTTTTATTREPTTRTTRTTTIRPTTERTTTTQPTTTTTRRATNRNAGVGCWEEVGDCKSECGGCGQQQVNIFCRTPSGRIKLEHHREDSCKLPLDTYKACQNRKLYFVEKVYMTTEISCCPGYQLVWQTGNKASCTPKR